MTELKQNLEDELATSKMHAEKECERRMAMSKRMVARMLHVQLARAFDSYSERVQECKGRKATCKRLIHRMLHAQLAAAFDCFSEAIKQLAVHRTIMLKATSRWRTPALKEMFERWLDYLDRVKKEAMEEGNALAKREFADQLAKEKSIGEERVQLEQERRMEQARRTVNRMLQVQVAAAFDSFLGCVMEKKRKRKVCRRVAMRMQHRALATAMWAWMEYMEVVARERKDQALEEARKELSFPPEHEEVEEAVDVRDSLGVSDAALTLILDLDFREAGFPSSLERAVFEKTLTLDVSTAGGIPSAHVSITRLSPGSVIASLTIHARPPGQNGAGLGLVDPLAVAADLEQQAGNPHSVLREGMLTRYVKDILVSQVSSSPAKQTVSTNAGDLKQRGARFDSLLSPATASRAPPGGVSRASPGGKEASLGAKRALFELSPGTWASSSPSPPRADSASRSLGGAMGAEDAGWDRRVESGSGSFDGEMSALQKDMQDFKGQLEERMAVLVRDLQEVREERDALKREVDSGRTALETAKKAELFAAEVSRASVAEQLAAATQELEASQRDKLQLQKEIAALQTSVAEAQSSLDVLVERDEEMASQRQRLQAQVQQVQQQLAAAEGLLQREREEREQERSQVREQRDAVEALAKKTEEERTRAREDEELAQEVAQLADLVKLLEEEGARVRAALEEAREEHAQVRDAQTVSSGRSSLSDRRRRTQRCTDCRQRPSSTFPPSPTCLSSSRPPALYYFCPGAGACKCRQDAPGDGTLFGSARERRGGGAGEGDSGEGVRGAGEGEGGEGEGECGSEEGDGGSCRQGALGGGAHGCRARTVTSS